MAIHLSMAELGITSATDLCELDNLTPPPMDNAVSALGIDEISADIQHDFSFIRNIGTLTR